VLLIFRMRQGASAQVASDPHAIQLLPRAYFACSQWTSISWSGPGPIDSPPANTPSAVDPLILSQSLNVPFRKATHRPLYGDTGQFSLRSWKTWLAAPAATVPEVAQQEQVL